MISTTFPLFRDLSPFFPLLTSPHRSYSYSGKVKLFRQILLIIFVNWAILCWYPLLLNMSNIHCHVLFLDDLILFSWCADKKSSFSLDYVHAIQMNALHRDVYTNESVIATTWHSRERGCPQNEAFQKGTAPSFSVFSSPEHQRSKTTMNVWSITINRRLLRNHLLESTGLRGIWKWH